MAIEKVLGSAALRRELGDNGRRRAAGFDLEPVAMRLLEALG
jgi:hypothetical protein